jgi:hypothetical protein
LPQRTEQVDVLEYSSSIGVWVPDNTTLVCSQHQVPKDILAKTGKSSLSQIQECARFPATGLDSEIEAIAAVPDFDPPTEKWFPWARTYERDEWLAQLVSRSDHAALEPAIRDRLFEAVGAAIDDHGGSFVMNFETVLITAVRLG